MKEKKAEIQTNLLKMIEEIGRQTESIKAKVSNGDVDIGDDIRALEHLVRDLKAAAGQPAFDRTAYQREYMRKKRAENPDYRPIIEPIRDLPDWRKPPLK
jgi:hypothetical protein